MSERRALEDDTALLAVSLDAPAAFDETSGGTRVTLPAVPASARAARSEVAGALRSWGLDDQLDVVALLVTEVVANAIRHAGGEEIDVMVALDESAVRVEVGDEGDGNPIPGLPPTAEDASGRGLMIVEGLASRWGYERRPRGGKRVWFELDR